MDENENLLQNAMFIYRTIQCSIPMINFKNYTNMSQWKSYDPTLFDTIIQNLPLIQSSEKSQEFSIDCVLLLGYPLIDGGKHEKNVMDMTKTYGVICVNPGYSIYEKNDKIGKEKRKNAEINCYDFKTQKHKTAYLTKKIHFRKSRNSLLSRKRK